MNQDSALSINPLRGADSFEGCFRHFQDTTQSIEMHLLSLETGRIEQSPANG